MFTSHKDMRQLTPQLGYGEAWWSPLRVNTSCNGICSGAYGQVLHFSMALVAKQSLQEALCGEEAFELIGLGACNHFIDYGDTKFM